VPETLRVEASGPRALVTLARPQVRNAFNEVVVRELREAFDALAAEPAVRVVVLAGDGPTFCAGADIDWMRRMADASREENIVDAAAMAGMFRAVAECPKFVVARVQGSAFGGGAGLVAAADAAVCEGTLLPCLEGPPAQAPVAPGTGSRFAFREVRLGIVPAIISEWVLARIGPGHARALFTTGEPFDAATALRIGLVAEVAPASGLDEAVERRVAGALEAGPAAVAAAKRLLRERDGWAALPAADRDLRAAAFLADLRATPEAREGLRAFLEKRRPPWSPA
jgi:methylglutaconyl-CoA hydratase